jgi:membrane protein DedA with SNARE-associated domain
MNFFEYIIDFVESLGYLGIFIMTVVEGTLIPIPNEITMIPAGYLVALGKMKLLWVIIAGVAGNLVGGLITYYIAYHHGRNLLAKYGKYVFFTEGKLKQVEQFFAKHGPISIAIGRIMPGLKHFISFPAGLAKMDLRLFIIFTLIGGGLWIVLLVLLGYFLGDNEAVIGDYLKKFQWFILVGIAIVISLYLFFHRKATKKHAKKG